MKPEMKRGRQVDLLPKDMLIKTGPVDHAEWCYDGLVGSIMRMRFVLVTRLIREMSIGRLLEVGYGSGVFAPELAKYCREYHGLDIHDRNHEVTRALRNVGVECTLHRGSITESGLPEKHYDCIIGVSVLSFVDDLAAACREILRLLKPNGTFIAVLPGYSPVIDFGFRLMTGVCAEDDFQGRRKTVSQMLPETFHIRRTVHWPSIPVFFGYLYRAMLMTPPDQ